MIERLVEQELAKSPLAPWKSSIVEMVWKTVRQPLLDRSFSLFDLEPSQVYPEMEFLFETSPDFVKGFIDLVFSFEDRYYIVDWKTNWLGPDEMAYHSFGQVMTSYEYWLQAALYTEAFRRHVKQFDMRSFEDIFGGAFYVFVRSPGVCHFIPDLTLIERAHGH